MNIVGYNILGWIDVDVDGTTVSVQPDVSINDDQQICRFVAQYIADGGVIAPYVPATTSPEMTSLTARQFWLAASRINITKADVLALVDAMEDKDAADDLRIEVTETASFSRTNPAVDELASLLGITSEQLDSLWVWAAQF
jgi:hypothetical protein